jgi:hypothetical protein
MNALVLHRQQHLFARAFGQNPLVRWTDRVEACLILMATLLALTLNPVCIAETNGVYRSHAQRYAAQSQTRHRITASVVETGPQPHLPHTTSLAILVLWIVGDDGARGGDRQAGHTAWITGDRTVKDGDHIDIWVDDTGARVEPPPPPFQATLDAVGFGAGVWGVAILGLIATVVVMRAPLDRIRRAQLDREINKLASGGRSERPK